MADIEISILDRNCLSQPVVELATLHRRVAAVEREANAVRATILWQFTTKNTHATLADL